ncbi:phosphoribosylformylglycinamidine cyclo-ligase [Leptotrichia sp. oral taxon 215 str. W9775]|uniref:phosphoribosylformylglycinamidine cyclo-ligase n=1 Tax=Leptotrichia sp. oral taxon 215 TaxID=712359 RepID=UPI0003AE570A|nr:phosphoribosylformylglycinamidine cyclo-ligase [Leptotrichia sp. oral taxon 215]ERK68427.1 phosphoribosylformylglycinamidine cyclo-ligase [Leptotrichia sp. oral taxon 215 str. W9775]
MTISYKDSGVDKEEGYRTVEKIKDKVKSTYSANVMNEIGSFGALYKLGEYKKPVLVSGTDGVGTKLKIAFETGKYDTVGIDCVAMCVNDILCHGAKPLFFLDYLACGKLDSDVSSEIIKGVADGCLQAGASLIGGETAEMPGFYTVGEYDIAGFAVGAVEEEEIVNGSNIEEGNAIIAISSSGPHSNGFSLIRKLFADLNEVYENKKIWEHLLTPTKIYVRSIQKLMESVKINGMAHITGGGLIENVPRTIPDGFCANIDKKKVEIPSIFKHEYFKKVTEDELWGTFNMGVGFIVIVKKEDTEKTIDILKENGENAYEIGYISKGENKLCLK